MKKCPFAKNEYCVEDNCSLWCDGCLVRKALLSYISTNATTPNEAGEEKIKAEIEKLKKQNEMLSMGFSVYDPRDHWSGLQGGR